MMQHGREPWEIYGNITYGASEHEMEWGSLSQPPLCTAFGCVFLYTQLSNGIIDSRPINHGISVIPDDRTWLLKCWSSCFWVANYIGSELVKKMVQHLAVMVKAWERSLCWLAGESRVAQLRFSGLCGHGPMGIPLDWLMVTTLMVHWFSGTFTWNFFGTQTYGKCHPIQIQWEKNVPSTQWVFPPTTYGSKGVSHHEGSNFAIRNEQSLGW